MHESGIALYHILNLGINRKWVVSFVLQPVSCRKGLWYLVGLRSGVDVLTKWKIAVPARNQTLGCPRYSQYSAKKSTVLTYNQHKHIYENKN